MGSCCSTEESNTVYAPLSPTLNNETLRSPDPKTYEIPGETNVIYPVFDSSSDSFYTPPEMISSETVPSAPMESPEENLPNVPAKVAEVEVIYV